MRPQRKKEKALAVIPKRTISNSEMNFIQFMRGIIIVGIHAIVFLMLNVPLSVLILKLAPHMHQWLVLSAIIVLLGIDLVLLLIYIVVFFLLSKRKPIYQIHGDAVSAYERGTWLIPWYRQIGEYDPAPRLGGLSVKLQTRDGKYVTGHLPFTWRPDPEEIHLFIEHRENINIFVLGEVNKAAQSWARGMLWEDVYKSPDIPTPEVPGVIIDNFAFIDRALSDDHTPVSPDFQQLDIRVIVESVENANEIEKTKAMLKEKYPGQKKLIEEICAQRTAKIKQRMLK